MWRCRHVKGSVQDIERSFGKWHQMMLQQIPVHFRIDYPVQEDEVCVSTHGDRTHTCKLTS